MSLRVFHLLARVYDYSEGAAPRSTHCCQRGSLDSTRIPLVASAGKTILPSPWSLFQPLALPPFN